MTGSYRILSARDLDAEYSELICRLQADTLALTGPLTPYQARVIHLKLRVTTASLDLILDEYERRHRLTPELLFVAEDHTAVPFRADDLQDH